ncbi:MAG: hypothetical protein Q9195_002378 [Heterodermia aff. obscurata]
MKLQFVLVPVALSLRASAAVLPAQVQDLDRRATTPAAPACTTNSDVVVNGAFYGYPNPPSYAPFTLTHTGGSPGCQYINGYTPCLASGGFGAADPNCFQCQYGATGGSDTISQQITFAPGCQYIVEATVACNYNSNTDYGTPHVFFRVTLDHTIVIPQQLSCPACKSANDPGCQNYPYPTYKVVSGTVVGPASGSGTLKVLVSQPAESVAVSPFLITALRMITPGTDGFTK